MRPLRCGDGTACRRLERRLLTCINVGRRPRAARDAHGVSERDPSRRGDQSRVPLDGDRASPCPASIRVRGRARSWRHRPCHRRAAPARRCPGIARGVSCGSCCTNATMSQIVASSWVRPQAGIALILMPCLIDPERHVGSTRSLRQVRRLRVQARPDLGIGHARREMAARAHRPRSGRHRRVRAAESCRSGGGVSPCARTWMDRSRNVCISTSIGRVCGSSAPTLYTPNQTNAQPAATSPTSSNSARTSHFRVASSLSSLHQNHHRTPATMRVSRLSSPLSRRSRAVVPNARSCTTPMYGAKRRVIS